METKHIVSEYTLDKCVHGTMIRKMSAYADELRKLKGDENVHDLTLGNPQIPPPQEYLDALIKISQTEEFLCHGYAPTTGLYEARKALAHIVDQFEEVIIQPEHIIMTCGCAGACNVFLKTILDPGDEVIMFSPYYLEYPFYIENYGGIVVEVPTHFKEKWQINKDELKKKLTNKTRCIIINSPNNPTGVVYTQETIDSVLKLAEEHSEKIGRPVWILNDDVYSRLRSPNVKIHSVFHYTYSVIAYSLSKDLSIPGERIGCLAVNPMIADNQQFVKTLATVNEILGFVHTNRLQMRIIPLLERVTVDLSLYNKSRELICQCLDELGIEYVRPEGALFVFPKIDERFDEWEFCKTLADNGVVTVPGSSFGAKGFYRMSCCQHPNDLITNIKFFKIAFKETIKQLSSK